MTAMSILHPTYIRPGKEEVIAGWLVNQDFYQGNGAPELVKVGGFRLEDPEGEVGIEMRIVSDRSGQIETIYHVPMTYRSQPLAGAQDFLIGTAEHGVLGTRYFYDAVGDPVFIAQIQAFAAGQVPAHSQDINGALEERVQIAGDAAGGPLQVVRVLAAGEPETAGVVGFWTDAAGAEHTGLVLRTA